MPVFVYRRRTPPNTPGTSGWYETITQNDPNIPAGFEFCHSDGAFAEALQQYVAGKNSGGFPPYTGDPTQVAAQPNWPNGILGCQTGNRVRDP